VRDRLELHAVTAAIDDADRHAIAVQAAGKLIGQRHRRGFKSPVLAGDRQQI